MALAHDVLTCPLQLPEAQVPPTQAGVPRDAEQTWPHDPQLFTSLERSKQLEPQSV
jgi:hypothetical protein